MTLRLRFATGDSVISNAIRAGERDGWCTHVEAVMPDGFYLGAHFDGGVEERLVGYDKTTMTRELFVDLDFAVDIPPRLWHVLKSGVPLIPDYQVINVYEGKFYKFLRDQLGKPYDLTAVAGLAIGRDWRELDSWFCSELIAAALESCGYLPKLSAADSHISPRDLLLVLSGRMVIPDAT